MLLRQAGTLQRVIGIRQRNQAAHHTLTAQSPGGRKKNQDKIARANAVAPVFESGMVWAPQTKWAEELIEECAAFPKGDNDDLVDSTTQALLRFRQGGFIRLPSDEPEEIQWFKGHRNRERFYTV